ncbi:MAG: winged helix-turn-helix domain-containing protein, partial [Proteobacteria bacterium]|nr:winged helix-turn-helix domain-containing protein [Pseudomonadota bacterium]
IVDVLVSNSVSTMLRADRAQAHEYKLQRGQIGDIQFDLLTGSLKIAEQRGDDLSPKEARIFDVLAGSANQCVSRSLLAISVWGDISVSERTLDTHISRLRRKISSSSECVIESVYGKGYSLVIQL